MSPQNNELEFIIKQEAPDFEQLPPDNYPAICCEFIHVGHIPSNFQDKQDKLVDTIILGFEIPDQRRKFKDDEPEQAYIVRKEFSLYLSSKSNLRKFLKDWRGKDFTEQELQGFNILKLVGAPGMLNVIHKEGTGKNAGKTYLEAASMAKYPSSLPKPVPFTPKRILTYNNFNSEVFGVLPNYIQEKMKSSKEYKELMGITDEPVPVPVQPNGNGKQPAKAVPAKNAPPLPIADETDDLPF